MNDLFQDQLFKPIEILPCDGHATYYGPILSSDVAHHYFENLLKEIQWEHDQAIIYGKHITTKRKVAWYADLPFPYTYSNTTKVALPWQPLLLELKEHAERYSGQHYNACLLNLYHDGNEGMAWHSDAEKELFKDGAIASISLGAERKFAFKHKNSHEIHSLLLEHGSLLVMHGTTQTHWLHRLPPTKKVLNPRINLTFRCMRTE